MPYVNHVIKDGTTLIDLTADTVTASTLMQGYTAHDASGAPITGTATGGGSGGNVWQDAQGYIHLDDEGGGSSIDVEPLSVTANGTYTAPSGTAYSPVTVNVSGGGEDTWSWMGRNPTRSITYTTLKTFRELGVGNWTWSTTQSTLASATNYDTTGVFDLNTYDVLILTRVFVHHDYGDWTPINAANDVAFEGVYNYGLIYNTISDYEQGVPSGKTGSSLSSRLKGLFFNSSGGTILQQSGLGVFSNTLPSVTTSGSNNASITFTFKCPAINVRGNTSYFSEDAFANLDLDESYYKARVEV